jgi:hypothetical protein
MKPVQLRDPKFDQSKPLMQTLKDRKTTREYSPGNLSTQTLSNLLWASWGINRPDSGGSNGARVKLWKLELQELADETGVEISVCHLPPWTSKWILGSDRLLKNIRSLWGNRRKMHPDTVSSIYRFLRHNF